MRTFTVAVLILVLVHIELPRVAQAINTESTLPHGSIIMMLGPCPAGFAESSALVGKFTLGTSTANGDVGTTGGSNSYTPAGTNGTAAFTPAGSNGTVSFTPAGSNTSGAYSEGAISWPAGVPTNASGAFSEGAISWPAGVPTTASVSAGTPAGTNGTVTVATTSGSLAGASSGAFSKIAGVNPGSAFTVGAETFTGSALAGHTHTMSWPAGVPTIAGGTFTQPTVSWPAGVPTIAAGSFTQPTFTGNAGTVPGETFTGQAGTVPAQAFSGTPATITPSYIKVIACVKN